MFSCVSTAIVKAAEWGFKQSTARETFIDREAVWKRMGKQRIQLKTKQNLAVQMKAKLTSTTIWSIDFWMWPGYVGCALVPSAAVVGCRGQGPKKGEIFPYERRYSFQLGNLII